MSLPTDLAVVLLWQRDQLIVLYSDGQGGFGQPVSHGLQGYPLEITAGDLNGDALTDLVATTPDGLRLFEGQTDRSLRSATHLTLDSTGPLRRSLARDLDGDGDVDLVSYGWASGQPPFLVRWLYQGSDDWERLEIATTERGTALSLGDYDSDGHDDIAVIRRRLAIHRGTGGGEYEAPVHRDGDGQGSRTYVDLCSADFDQDGVADVAGVTSRIETLTQGEYSWFASQATVSVWTGAEPILSGRERHDIEGAPGEVECADLDGDGDPELLYLDRAHESVRVARGTSVGLT